MPDLQRAAGVGLHRAPHFVGIGAPRCGTTWAFKLLRLHPEVWMPWKEIHYFDSLDPSTDSGFAIQDRAFRLRRGWMYGLRRLAASSIPVSQRAMRRYFPLRAVPAPGISWTARYFLGDASLGWYHDLFREGVQSGLRCGEITPAYFMLSAGGIDRFVRALPETRVFLLLRDPVEWAWSDVRKRLQMRGRRPDALSDAELIAECSVPTGNSRADFGSNVQRWLERIVAERLFLGFHDEIRTAPGELLDRLCAFIGVSPFPAHLRGLLQERVNSSTRGSAIPPAVERHVAAKYRDQARLLAGLVGGRAEQWLSRIDAVLDRRYP